MLIGSPPVSATRLIDPTESPDWNQILSSAGGRSFFHTSNWAAVLKEAYSYKPIYFTRFDEHALSALFPVIEVQSPITGKRGVAVPFTDRCEPVAANREQFLEIFREIIEYGAGAGWKYLELRGGAECLGDAVPSRTYLGHSLRLDEGEAALFRGLDAAYRRNIRRAVDQGVRVVISKSERDLDDYYKLHCLTRKRHGVPPQPRNFFRAIYRHVISRGKGFTALGIHHGKAVAGAVYFYSGEKAIFKFGASDLLEQHLRANNLVMWEAIKWFSNNGFRELCFGRTDPENTGLARFKRGWGTREEELHYFRYDLGRSMFVRETSSLDNNLTHILTRAPIPVLRLIGTLLYRHMG